MQQVERIKADQKPATPADFVRAAVVAVGADHRSGDLREAARMLRDEPSLTDDFYAACAAGAVDAVRRHLERDASLARSSGGPHGWPAVCYATFSKYLRVQVDAREADFEQVVGLLLDHGAEANAFWMSDDAWGKTRETALYGAAGIANSAAVTRRLLGAGALPDLPDGETLYHVAEHLDHRCLKLILPHVPPGPWLTYCMCHGMDSEDVERLKLFIDRGGNVNAVLDRGQPKGWRPLHFAIDRGRSIETIRALIDAGADAQLPTDTGESVLSFALRRGRRDVVELLESLGSTGPIDARSRWLLAAASGDREAALSLRPATVELSHEEELMLPHVAGRGDLRATLLLLDLGWPINTPGNWGGPALHQAIFANSPDLVHELLDRGASLTARNNYGGDALGCTIHLLTNGHPEAQPLFDAIARRMTAEQLRPTIEWHKSHADGNRAIAERLRRIVAT